MARQRKGPKRPRDCMWEWPHGELRRDATDFEKRLAEEAAGVAIAIREATDRRDSYGKRVLTNRRLAELVGVSEQTIGNIVHGRTYPDFATLVALAEALEEDLTIHWRPVRETRAPTPAVKPDPEAVRRAEKAAETRRREQFEKETAGMDPLFDDDEV